VSARLPRRAQDKFFVDSLKEELRKNKRKVEMLEKELYAAMEAKQEQEEKVCEALKMVRGIERVIANDDEDRATVVFGNGVRVSFNATCYPEDDDFKIDFGEEFEREEEE
jgi:uncharacterized Rmd1/YagE family protein